MVASITLIAALFWSPRPPSDLFLVAAGQLRSATGKEFRTTVWISNLSASPARVQATFLERHPVKVPPPSIAIDLAPNATRELTDLPLQLRRTGVVGAIRFQCSQPIAVSARIFSGPETTGTFLKAEPYNAGLRKSDEGLLQGVSYEGDVRQITYLVETGGRPTGVFIQLRDASGREIANESLLLEPYEQRSLPIAELARNTRVRNGSIIVRVTGGGGCVYASGLQIPTSGGDGYFVGMTVTRSRDGIGMSTGEMAVYALTALVVIAAMLFEFYRRKSRLRG
ncbi:MAG TPA: hypothetical protein VII32_15365 [Thermoanaerobaculia bacterium]|jgi:hypothetical protein